MSSNDPSPPSQKSPGQTDGSFSIDHDESIQLEIPSVTKLLNRKKLELETKGEPEVVEPTVPAARPQIKGAQRGDRRSGKRLVVLPVDASPNPSADSAEALVRSLRAATGAVWVLLLSPFAKEASSLARQFEARSILGGDRTLWNLLTGFQWGATTSPSSYQELSMNRCLELTARSTHSDARALRAALAMDQALGLWMIATGKKSEAPTLVLMAALADPSKVQLWLKQNETQLQKVSQPAQ